MSFNSFHEENNSSKNQRSVLMKLYLNETSPFARFVLICIMEYELDQPELIWVNPWEWEPALVEKNPFSMVPVLLTESNDTLYESSIIVKYLTKHKTSHSSFNEYQWEGFSKILLETAFRHVSLARYSPKEGKDHPFIVRTERMLQSALGSVSTFPLSSTEDGIYPLGALQLATALDYIDFRLPSLSKKYLSKKISAEMNIIRKRPSFVKTNAENIAKLKQKSLQ